MAIRSKESNTHPVVVCHKVSSHILYHGIESFKQTSQLYLMERDVIVCLHLMLVHNYLYT